MDNNTISHGLQNKNVFSRRDAFMHNSIMELKYSLDAWMKLKGLDQTALQDISGVPQPTINRILTGVTTSPRGDTLSKIAAAMGIGLDKLMCGPNDASENKSEVTYPRTPSEDDYALIPQYSTKGACGSGAMNDHVEVVGGLAFKRDWLKRFGLKESNACVIYATGSSMSPTLEDGDVVLLDTSAKELQNGKVYALCIDNEVRIKRVRVSFGKITLVSDNPDKLRYADEEVPSEVELDVIGRGVWQGGGL